MHRSISLFVLSTVAAFLLTIMLVPAQSASAFNAFFDFNGYAVGTSAENVAAPGIKMSSDTPNGWRVVPAAPFQTMNGNVLRTEVCDAELVIVLDSYYNTLDLRFGVSNGATALHIQGFTDTYGYHHGFVNTYEGFKSVDNVYEGTVSEDIRGMKMLVIRGHGGCAAIDDLRLNDMPIIDLNPEILTRNPIIIPQPLPLPGPITIEPIVIRGN